MKKMSRIDRIALLLKGEPLDRVPVSPFDMTCGTGWFCTRNVGFPIEATYNDPERSFWAQVWTQEQYGYDGNPTFGYASYGAWEFGGEIVVPNNESRQAPWVIQHPIQSKDDIDKLQLPNIKTSGIVPLTIQFSKLQESDNMPITFPCGSPLTYASNLVGLDKLCRWIVKEPSLVHQLLRICTDHILQVVQHWIENFRPEQIIPHDILPIEDNRIISPKQFETFALPYLKEVHEKVLAMGIKRFSTHICGEQNANLHFWKDIPMGDPGIVSFGHEVEINKAIDYFGEKCIIAGNIEPTIIQTGTAQQLYQQCKLSIEKARNAPRGYILAPGCDIPPMTPPYHIYIMIKAANDYGRYNSKSGNK
jgi:uroporphyrinogen decarboxylase